MLHVLLLILKIIGIILAAILGILVLLVCIVLFVPVRYEVTGRCDGSPESLKGKVRITWLLHLAAVDLLYKDKCLRWRFRVAWLKRTGGKGGVPEKAETAEETELPAKKAAEAAEETELPAEEAEPVEQDHEKISEEEQKHEETKEQPEEIVEFEKEVYEKDAETEEAGEIEEDSAEEGTGLGQKIRGIYEKAAACLQKIKCTISGLCDKIKALLEKKDKLTAFIQDEVHVSAFWKVKKEVFRYLRHLKPKKAEVKAVYGFEDPYHTGQVLAGLSVLYPFIGEYTSITPDFENKVLKGSVYIKGSVYVCHIAWLCLKLILCKNVRTTYKHIKNFEL